MTATPLRLAPAEDGIARLEARQKELYALLARLRAADAPRAQIRELVLEIDEHDSRVAAARALPPAPPVSEPPPLVLRIAPRAPLPATEPEPVDPAHDESGRLPLARILTGGAAIVAAAAVAGTLLAGRGTSVPPAATAVGLHTVPAAAPPAHTPPPIAASVPVRLQTHAAGTPCGAQGTRTALRWTWTLPPGYDGQPATIETRGPGLAGSYRRTVVGSRVDLTYSSPCLAPGAVWAVSLESVGPTPARLTAVEQIP